MGVYTIETYKVLELQKDPGTGLRIGLNDYPIFDSAYRIGLNQKIINHFYLREIGRETISQWTFALRRKMWEIMPIYNQIYLSTRIEFDPLSTFDLTTIRQDTSTEEGTSESNTSASGTGASGARTVNSEFPQSQLSEDGDYASSASDATSNSTSSNTGTGTNSTNNSSTGNGTSQTKGYQGSAARLLMEYRASLLNVDMMVIGELNELFMGIWDNRQEYIPIHSRGYYFD